MSLNYVKLQWQYPIILAVFCDKTHDKIKTTDYTTEPAYTILLAVVNQRNKKGRKTLINGFPAFL